MKAAIYRRKRAQRVGVCIPRLSYRVQMFEALLGAAFGADSKMSALPPKADIGAAVQNVRFVPIADMRLLPEP